MTTKRSRIVGNAQDIRLGVLRRVRQAKPFDTPDGFDRGDVPVLVVLEAAEHLVRTVRLARIAAAGEDLYPAYRRVAVVGAVSNAILHDFTEGGSSAVDAIYYLLQRRSEVPDL